jgi:regulatory protein
MALRRPASLKVRALQWLAQREHSPLELRAKLLRAAAGRPVPLASDPDMGHDLDEDAADPDERQAAIAAEVDGLIAWLAEHRYLSVERFVESRIHARQARFGNQRIQHELQQHGVRLEAPTQQALRESELARARALWDRKFGEPAADPAGRLRQMRFLAGRGFSAATVQRVIKGSVDRDDD